MRTKLIYALISVLSLGVVLGGSTNALGTASFSLSPSNGSYVQNSNFTVQLFVNGTDINVVTAKLTYDASKLSCNTIGSSSAFPNTIVASCGGGTITISRYSMTNVSGSLALGSISFKALASSGSTNISFLSISQIASNGSNIWSGNTNGASFTLTAPVAPQPVQQPSQPITSPAPNNPTVTPATVTSSTTTKKVLATATPAVATPVEATPTTASTETDETAISSDTKALAVTTTSNDSTTQNNIGRDTTIWIITVLAIGALALYAVRYRRQQKVTTGINAAKVATHTKKASPKKSSKKLATSAK